EDGRLDVLRRRHDELDHERLPGRVLAALVAVDVEQARTADRRLAGPPLAKPGSELVRASLLREEPPVARDRVARRTAERDTSLAQQDGAIAEPLDGPRVVRDEDDRAAAPLDLRDLPEALPLEVLVADREHLVEQEHIGLDVRRDGEAKPHVHPGRV